MDLSQLQSLLAEAEGATVACVGDLMLDRYVYGEVSRVSPEAPIPVLLQTRKTAMPGAAGNVARNVAALGGRARLNGVLGSDAAGRELAALLEAEPGVESFLDRPAGAVTTVKTRFVAAGQQLLRLDAERPIAADRPAAAAGQAMDGAAAILISDYAKGAVGPALLAAAHAAGAPVVVDPKGRDFRRYGPVALIKPNAAELREATGLPTGTDAEVEVALAAALGACEAEAVLVTRAGQGMSLARRGQAVRHFRARAREVFDVSGAGDTSLAALGLALAAGAGLETAVEFAILASGVAVGKSGTAVVTPAELVESELAAHAAPATVKIVTAAQAAADAAAWRAQGLKVGFTNGCFDILHPGHVTYLTQARGWCDRLIVALNSDASVRALKGESRPVNDLEGRALVLAGLASVDRVTSFDAPTPIALIEAIRPDVLIKGADYTVDTVVGADLVKSWGGEVRLADFVDGHSTTRTLKRMAGA